ncbi:hypothetical protein RM780_09685 [Streptomyces sp. DSM 44917]|uniref:Uncharacterized protein n=1 Tax=Streptomyces boetiae TaxID=3075541 RepID=A0ABU2L6P5_9ACTN|nr:hypothetical protein [Streptomyces sp. DSM 44917]MDT0307233.1 hypothetical protein [Streptomyces sp. DSM 44917]
MRCSTTRPDRTCTRTATHVLLSAADGNEKPAGPVCEPCGTRRARAPGARTRLVPLAVIEPPPGFIPSHGHRLIRAPRRGEPAAMRCLDCQATAPHAAFCTGWEGCPGRPESLNYLSIALLPGVEEMDASSRAQAMAGHYRTVAGRIGLPLEDWQTVLNDPAYCAFFTFRDRAYGLRYGVGWHGCAAEPLPNGGAPAPGYLDAQFAETFRQVVFGFRDLDTGSGFFACHQPGEPDIVRYTPEGRIEAVLRLADGRPRTVEEITEAVAATWGPVATVRYSTRVYPGEA